MLIDAERYPLLVIDLQVKRVPAVADHETIVANAAWLMTRMRDEGVRVVTRETVVFEWLGKAGTPVFREVNPEFLR